MRSRLCRWLAAGGLRTDISLADVDAYLAKSEFAAALARLVSDVKRSEESSAMVRTEPVWKSPERGPSDGADVRPVAQGSIRMDELGFAEGRIPMSLTNKADR